MNQKELFIISLCVFLTVIAWLVADIYHTNFVSKTNVNSVEIIKPLDSKIDTDFFEILKKKTP